MSSTGLVEPVAHSSGLLSINALYAHRGRIAREVVVSRSRVVPILVLLFALPSVALAAPGDEVTEYGTQGEVPIEWITTEVGIVGFIAAPDGRAILNVATDSDSSVFSIVSADGSEVTTVGLPGSGEAAFGPGSSVFAAYSEGAGTTAAKYDASGVLVPAFGVAGTAEIPVDGSTFPSAVVSDGSSVVVGGGTFDLDDLDAWIARLDGVGSPDPSFGGDGVVEVVETSSPDADFVMVERVYVIDDGYLAVTLIRGLGGDVVTVVPVSDDGSVGASTELSFPDELFSVGSTQMVDGSVIVGLQTTAADIDTFHLYRFDETGVRDEGFADPAFTADEVGGRLFLAGLRTDEVALGMNIGSDLSYDVHLFDESGGFVGSFPIPADDRSDTWIFGAAATWHDGGLLLPTDPVPSNPTEPDEVVIVKYQADESGRFVDDDGSVHETDIETLAALGITKGCNPPANTNFCPRESVTRAQMAAFLVRALGLPAATTDHFTDDNGSIFEDDINRLAEAGITKGCNPPANDNYCPDDPVTRGQMAALLVRALPLPAATVDHFTDDDGSIFADDINRLAEAGITRGCNPPANDNYCPDDPVTREQMASFIIRALATLR